MKPSIGRIVIVRSPLTATVGTEQAPAIITRIPDDQGIDTIDRPVSVNLTALPDGGQPVILQTVWLFDTEEKANAQWNMGLRPVAWWPARV